MPKQPTGQRAPLPLPDQIGIAIDRLCELQRDAADDRRPHHRTEQLLDGIADVSATLRRLARG